MLHPTRLPDCADLLDHILDFQERLLELGCSSASLTPNDLQQELGQQIFNWLDSSALLYKVYQFARFPQDEKEAILADFRHDRQYIHHLSDNNFQFRLLGDTGDPNRERIKSWLVKFYEQFARVAGIDGFITGRGTISKGIWWQAYSAANGDRLTCAVCDGTMNHAMTVEHYLPKGRYPALALHPHNIIPTCDKCNSLKGDKDPLDGRSFQSIVIPYHESIRRVAHLEFEEGQEGTERMRIVPNNNATEYNEKVSSLAFLFDLPGQWQQNIHEIGKIAMRRVSDYFAGLYDEGIYPPPEEILARLNRVCARMEQEWGIEHYGYPATEWLRWVSANKSENVLAEVAASLSQPAPRTPYSATITGNQP